MPGCRRELGSSMNGAFSLILGVLIAMAVGHVGHAQDFEDLGERIESRSLRTPPVIVVSPQSQTLVAGSTVTLSVRATGTGPLT